MELLLLLIVIIEANDEGVGDGAGDGDVGSGGGRQVHGVVHVPGWRIQYIYKNYLYKIIKISYISMKKTYQI